MRFFKKGDKHALQIYLVGAAIMIFALASGMFWNATPQNTLLRMLCDGTSLSAAAYFLLAFVYRPKGFRLAEVMGFYRRRVFGQTPKDSSVTTRDHMIEEKIDNDFLESMLMLWITLILTIVFLLIYML